jgi:O-antigen/teichoic acid export membrane protein
MGIVRRQGFWNTILTYLGVAIAYLNNVFLFREFLLESEYGLIQLLISLMVIGTEFSQFGLGKIIIRFFPYFHQHPQREGSFLFFVILYACLGFALFALLFFSLESVLLTVYAEETVLFVGRHWYLVPMILAFSMLKILRAFSQALLKSVVPVLTQDVLLRVSHTLIIILYLWQGWAFDTFLQFYVWAYFVPVVILLVYLAYLRELKLSFSIGPLGKRVLKLMLYFGLFTLLAEASVVLVSRLDSVMLGALAGKGQGELTVAAYAFAFYIATLVYMPARALNSIAGPLAALKLKQRKLMEVQQLYHKTALNNLLTGGLFLIGIWINLDPFFAINDTFSSGKTAAILLGIGNLANMSTGISRAIIVNSKLYRFDLWANLFMLVLVILGNYLLIPLLGETGAAITTMVSLAVFNGGSAWYIWYRMRIQPFHWRNLLGLGVVLAVLLLGLALPDLENPYLDIVYRSALVTVVYVPLVLGLKVSPDLNEMALGVWRRLSRKP